MKLDGSRELHPTSMMSSCKEPILENVPTEQKRLKGSGDVHVLWGNEFAYGQDWMKCKTADLKICL